MITITCKYCGNTSIRERKGGPEPQFCLGYSCRDKYRREKLKQTLSDVPCAVCGKQLTELQVVYRQRYCSSICGKKAGGSTLRNNLEITKANCTQCGREIDYPILTGIANEIMYCDLCRQSHERDRSRQRRLVTKEQRIDTVNDLEVYERDSWICKICNNPVDSGLDWPDPMSPSLDHVVPISKGGPHAYTNVQLAHLGCNSRKQDRYEARA